MTDKTVDQLYDLMDLATKALNDAGVDCPAAITAIFDAQDLLLDYPAVPGIEGVDRPAK